MIGTKHSDSKRIRHEQIELGTQRSAMQTDVTETGTTTVPVTTMEIPVTGRRIGSDFQTTGVNTDGITNADIAANSGLVNATRQNFLQVADHIDQIHNRCVLELAPYKDPTLRAYLGNVLAGLTSNATTWALPTGLAALLGQLRSPVGEDKLAECVVSFLKDRNFTEGIKTAIAEALASAPEGTDKMFLGPNGVFQTTLIVFSLAAVSSLVSEPLTQMVRRGAGGGNYLFGIAGDGRSPYSAQRSNLGNAANNFGYLIAYCLGRTFLEQPIREAMSDDPSLGTYFAAGGLASLIAALCGHLVLQGALMAGVGLTMRRNEVEHAHNLGDPKHQRALKPGVLLQEQAKQRDLDYQERSSIYQNLGAVVVPAIVGAVGAAATNFFLAKGGIGGAGDFRPTNATNTTLAGPLNVTSSSRSLGEQALSPGLTTFLPFTAFLAVTTSLRTLYGYLCRHPAGNANHFDIAASKRAVRDLKDCQLQGYEAMLDAVLKQNASTIHASGMANILNNVAMDAPAAKAALQEIDRVIHAVHHLKHNSQDPDTCRAAERERAALQQQLQLIRSEVTGLHEAFERGELPGDIVRTQNNLTKLLRQLPHQTLQMSMSNASLGAQFDLDRFAGELTQAILPLALAGRTRQQSLKLDTIYQDIGLLKRDPAHAQVTKLVNHQPPQQVVASFANMQPDVLQNLGSKIDHWLAARPPGPLQAEHINAHLLLQVLRPPTQPVDPQRAADLVATLGRNQHREPGHFERTQSSRNLVMGELQAGRVTLSTLDAAMQAFLVANPGAETQGALHELKQTLAAWRADGSAEPDAALVDTYRDNVKTWPQPYQDLVQAAASIPPNESHVDDALGLMKLNPFTMKDVHFHPTNYSETHTDLVKMYDLMLANNVVATNLAGIPTRVQKCCDGSKYYSNSHEDTAYINPDDALSAQWDRMTPEQQSRMALSMTGFDVNDAYHVRKHFAQHQKTHGDKFKTAGEFTGRKEGGIDKKNASEPDPGGEGVREVFRQCADRGYGGIYHGDAHRPRGKRHEDALLLLGNTVDEVGRQVLGEVTQLELDVRRALGPAGAGMPPAKTKLCWAHGGGIGKFVTDSVKHTHFLSEVFSGRGIESRVDEFLDSRNIPASEYRNVQRAQILQHIKDNCFVDLSWDVVNQHMYSNLGDQLKRLARENRGDPQCSQNLETLAVAFKAYTEQYKIFTQVGAAADKAEDIQLHEQSAALLTAARRQFEHTRAVMAAAIVQMQDICRHPATRDVLAGAMREHGPEKQNNWLYIMAQHHERLLFGTDSLTPLAKAHGKEAYALNVQSLHMFFFLLNGMETGDPLNEGRIVKNICEDNFEKFVNDPQLALRRKMFAHYEQNLRMEVASTTPNAPADEFRVSRL